MMSNQLFRVFLSKTSFHRFLCYSSVNVNQTKYQRRFKMQDDYVMINSVPTHIFTWGKWLNEKFDNKNKDLVFLITGNPGLPGYYTKFCSSLYNELDKETPIWVIGHAGHDEPKDKDMKTPPLKGNEHLYDLQGQINHKIDFIQKYIPKDARIYLIGHSVGAKISTELLKIPEFSKQVEKCYLMCPTLEHIAKSTKGLKVPSFDRFFFLWRIFYNTFNLLPTSLKSIIVKFFIKRDGMDPEEFLKPSLEYTNPRVIDKIWFMALDEMEKIKDLDVDNIKGNKDRLKIYYAAKDDWVRSESYSEIIEKVPGIDAEVCTRGFEHAFVLKTGPESAKLMSEWINQHRNKK